MNTVYIFDGEYSFVKKDQTFANNLLNNEKESLFYVRDNSKNVVCFCGLGGHLSAIIFLLRKYYGLVRYTESDIGKWQKIISENFSIYNSLVDSPEYYAEEVMTGSSVYWSSFLEEKTT